MTTSLRFSRTASAIAVALGLASATAVAQDTSASLRGEILGPQGSGAANTKVVIEHVPSGSRTEVTTDNSGTFIASGLRVGGPYRITLDSDVYQDAQYSEVFLKLGETFRLNAQLEANDVERITVTGQAINYAQLNNGSSSSFGEEQIEALPTYSRDLKEIVRLNPLATQLGDGDQLVVAGNNPRYNSITVDGIAQNDDFGLNSNGYPTQGSPISIDAIEQITVDVVPFNAKDTNFTGAKVNAVTKSGTNELKGSVFYQYTSDSLAGDAEASKYDEDALPPNVDYEEKTLGISLGGPVIKDKLFFYVNYETQDETNAPYRGPIGSDAANIANITTEELEQVLAIARDVYGLTDDQLGGWDIPAEEEDEKLLVKLDWNISNEHRAAFTYQHTDGNSIRNQYGGDGTLTLSSSWYNNEQILDAYALQVYSNWNSNFSSDIKLSYKNVEANQDPLNGRTMGMVTVEVGGRNAIEFGPDYSRHANEGENSTLEFQANGEYLLGDHAIGFGYAFSETDIYNLFVQNALGSWEFDSIEDFENREAGAFYYAGSLTGDINDAAANFTQGTQALYIQDTWQPTWDLELMFGLRYERMHAEDKPVYNEKFAARYNISNTENLDGKDLFLPRLGFKYQLTDDVRVRGGVGRYAGGRPNVWVSNSYTNNGETFSQFDRFLSDVPWSVFFDNVDPTQVPQAVQDGLIADGYVNAIDPEFDLPSDWRGSLGVDFNNFSIPVLGDDWFASVEYIYTRRKDDVQWKDLTRVPLLDEDGNPRTTIDGGRILYVVDDPLDDHEPMSVGDHGNVQRYDLLLTNGDGGKSQIFTTTLGKAWDNGFSFRTSYTNQDIEEAVAGSSSTAISNYRFPVAIDRQNVRPGTASYQVEHRFMADFTYKTELFSGYTSTFGLFWERYSGRPWGYVYDSYGDVSFGNQPFGTLGQSSVYLPYIPTGPNDPAVAYENNFSYEQFMDYLQRAGLEGYEGGYLPRNTERGPWTTNLDFKFTQELPGFVEGHKGELYINVRNLIAIFDKEAGQKHVLPYGDNVRELVSATINDDGQYVYGVPYNSRAFDVVTQAPTRYLPERSTWQAKIGIRYRF
ncbi:TonB-dependent receptor [Pseudidiomarina terrestris]|uniref:TonB-dependent receptor n=1 Tax=Pseudidiomarina terrestris TaxID=2820060 RepID=UPI0026544786|nr:TonB-dependent receptor [Pseudidiomarina sp. 1ASP75-5]MDN7136046.1 TonB-dependent receptor [Pseudidiomarina sp. 1ASP75-5]